MARTMDRQATESSVLFASSIDLLIALGVAALIGWTSIDMMSAIIVIAVAWLVAIFLLWSMTPAKKHRIAMALGTVLLSCIALPAVWWVIKHDRPILPPKIEGVITQNYNGSALGLDIETFVKNVGRQSGYADRWQFVLVIDGTTMDGRELHGQSLPSNAVNEPPISDQEFPPGKPVRGWLFFAFPGVSYDYAARYFTCSSPLMDKVSLHLSVWDSKMKHEYTQTKSLIELGKESCIPVQLTKTAAPDSSKGTAGSGVIKQKVKHDILQNGNNDQTNPVTVKGNQITKGDESPIFNGSNNTNTSQPKP